MSNDSINVAATMLMVALAVQYWLATRVQGKWSRRFQSFYRWNMTIIAVFRIVGHLWIAWD